MTTVPKHNGNCIPFPPLPEKIRDQFGINGVKLRPFGRDVADLEIDFLSKNRPNLVTEILKICTVVDKGDPPSREFYWELTIGKRIEALMMLVLADAGATAVFQFDCRQPECGETMESEVALEGLMELQRQADANERVQVNYGKRKISIRKPTGIDQREWLKFSSTGETETVKALIRPLICGVKNERVRITDRLARNINAALGETDPLVNLTVSLSCPHCGKEAQYPVDAEQLALQMLQRYQFELLTTIHRLATHYHWSEDQVLAIPTERRRRYLNLIDQESGQ